MGQCYEKTFDKVQHQDLFDILEEIGWDGRYPRRMKNLYWNQRAGVRVPGEVSELQHIKRGVRQGCVLSPDLFNIYSEAITKKYERTGRHKDWWTKSYYVLDTLMTQLSLQTPKKTPAPI